MRRWLRCSGSPRRASGASVAGVLARSPSPAPSHLPQAPHVPGPRPSQSFPTPHARPARPPPSPPSGSHGSMGDNTSPISVILVSSGSRGNKLLFRYPFQRSQEHPASQTSKCARGAGPALRARAWRPDRGRLARCSSGPLLASFPADAATAYCLESAGKEKETGEKA